MGNTKWTPKNNKKSEQPKIGNTKWTQTKWTHKKIIKTNKNKIKIGNTRNVPYIMFYEPYI